MTERAILEERLHELYAARISGPLDRLCGVFTPDVHFRIAGASEGKPIAIAADGIDAVHPWLSMLVKTFRVSDHRVLSTVIEGNRASVHWRANIHSRITGAQIRTELVDLVEFREKLIVSYVEFFVPL